MTLTVRPVSHDLVVTVKGSAPSLTPEIQARVDAEWQAATEENAGLFDGLLYSSSQIEENTKGEVMRVKGCFVPYRQYLACRRNSSLAATLDLWVVGISGLLICGSGVVVGRRSTSTTDAGRWELAPSGTIGPDFVRDGYVDIHGLILSELTEEVGLTERDLTDGPSAFVFLTDSSARISDIGIRMTTSLEVSAIQSAQARLKGREYDQLKVVSPRALQARLMGQDDLIPASRGLLLAAGLVDGNLDPS